MLFINQVFNFGASLKTFGIKLWFMITTDFVGILSILLDLVMPCDSLKLEAVGTLLILNYDLPQ